MVPKASFFECTEYSTDWGTGELSFSYKVELEDGTTHNFTERLWISESIDTVRAKSPAVENALKMLHLVLGLSYYKAFIPQDIRHRYDHSPQQAKFWSTLYTKGLGEFFYVNQLDFRDRVKFPVSKHSQRAADAALELSDRALVLHGGGKDSIVSVEFIKKTGMDFDLFSVNAHDIQNAVAANMGKTLFTIKRELDQNLINLIQKGSVYDGHVPISAIYTAVSVLYALLFDYRYVVSSNERSAVHGNVDYLGMTINHQWSKSQEFETMMRDYTFNNVSKDLEFFSLLRPLYEIHIAKIFAQYPQYFESFSSSNHNFTIDQSGEKRRWSVDYSKGKVEFVWTLLSAFLPKAEMLRIFQENIYEREDALNKFKELLGVKDIKPLECVGTPEEMLVAICMAHERGEFEDTVVMKYFVAEVLPGIEGIEGMKREVFSYGDDSCIPDVFKEALKDSLDSSDS